jgi:hypothetical protein
MVLFEVLCSVYCLSVGGCRGLVYLCTEWLAHHSYPINQQIHNLGTHRFDLGKPQMRFLLTMPSGNKEISPDTTECPSVLERQHLPSPNPDLSRTQKPEQTKKCVQQKESTITSTKRFVVRISVTTTRSQSPVCSTASSTNVLSALCHQASSHTSWSLHRQLAVDPGVGVQLRHSVSSLEQTDP